MDRSDRKPAPNPYFRQNQSNSKTQDLSKLREDGIFCDRNYSPRSNSNMSPNGNMRNFTTFNANPPSDAQPVGDIVNQNSPIARDQRASRFNKSGPYTNSNMSSFKKGRPGLNYGQNSRYNRDRNVGSRYPLND